MRKILLACFTALLSAGCTQTQKSITVTDGILIENIVIISPDSTGRITSRTGNIVLDGSAIVAIDQVKPSIKGESKIIDGTGKYIIPGLIDSHVHLNNIAGLNFKQRRANPSLVEEYFERLPKNFLYFGYTSLIDLDNYAPDVIQQLKSVSTGPEIYTCGKKVQVMNDFEMVMNELTPREKMNQPFLYDKYNTNINYPDTIDLGEHTAKMLVNTIVSQGAICVKALYEDASSGLPLLWQQPSKAIMEELVNEAHKEGLCIVMHAPSFEGQRFALESGVDILAHAMWNWTSDAQKFLDTELPLTHQELLLEIARKQIGYQPTFRTILGELDILKDDYVQKPELLKLYRDGYLDYLKSEEAKWSRNRIFRRPEFLSRINPDFINPIRSKFETDEELFDALYESYKIKIETVLRFMAENDGNLLFGTDSGAMNMYTHTPGLNGYLEMKHWDDSGVSLKQLLKAATYNNAKAFNLFDSVGSIETGKRANLILLNSNPLESVQAYDDIYMVIHHGQALYREELAVPR